MIEPKLALKIVKRGTHILPVAKWNDDVPSPAECVAEALADVEYYIGELVKAGGAINNSAFYARAKNALSGLNDALNAASKQNWQLEVERNPDVVQHMRYGPETPVKGCNCDVCAEVRE
jgi:hypothetical protein